MVDSGQCQGRGFLCPNGHELRITRRCLEDDLGENPDDCEFESMSRAHPIVRAFRNRRAESTGSGDTVGPAAGEMTVYTLRHSHHHRGATWFDAESKVVWLLATGNHRSGQPGDAFEHFQDLRERDELYPDAADLEDLLSDRSEEFVQRAKLSIPQILAEAQAESGVEVQIEIGSEPVSCVVHVVELAEERFFSVSGNVGLAGLAILKALFAPDSDYEEWRSEPRLPTRELDYSSAEMCFSIFLDSK